MDDPSTAGFNKLPARAFFKRSYHRLPNGIKCCFMPAVKGYRRFQQAYRPVYLYSGRTGANQVPFTFAYIGSDLNQQNFWSGLIFKTDVDKMFIGNHFIFRTPAFLRKKYPRCSMMICEENPFTAEHWQSKFILRVPRWLRMEIDLSQPMERMCKNKLNHYKRIKRRIRLHRYDYSTTQSLSAFREFYDNMYVPYIRSRYSGVGIVLPYSEMFDVNTPVELFLVRKAGEVVAGGVVKYGAANPSLAWFGVSQANFNYVREGALGAAYYFVITEMQKRGYATLGIGDSRPVLNYGVTRHKLGLLASVKNSFEKKSGDPLLFILLNDCEGLRDFLTSHQIICETQDGGFCPTFWPGRTSIESREEICNAAMLSHRAGFRELRVIFFEDGEIPVDWFETDDCDYVRVTNAGEYFLPDQATKGWRW